MNPGDTVTPPLAPQMDDLLTCVHCGFCLSACPTYELLGNENDSPRGRIYMMRAVAEGRLSAADGSFGRHIDQCLGCRACEPVCPSGVRYGSLLEHAREARADSGAALDKFVRLGLRLVFANRWLQNLSWALLRLLRATRAPRLIARLGSSRRYPGRLRFGMAMLAATAEQRISGLRRPHHRGAFVAAARRSTPDTPSREPLVALLEGCVMSGLYRHVNRSTERVVQAHGAMTVGIPSGFCCGALHAHSGELEKARDLARRLISVYEKSGAELFLTNSAGCGAALRDYPDWLADDPAFSERAANLAGAVRMVSEWLAQRPGPRYRRLATRVAYDAPCHLLHAQRIGDAPIELLTRIPGVEVVPLARADRCCGAAGVYGITRRKLSEDILQRKLAEISEADAPIVTTGNPGCLMQIGAGTMIHGPRVKVLHPVELLDLLLDYKESD